MESTNYKQPDPRKPNYILLAAGLVLFVLPVVMFVVDPAFIIIQYVCILGLLSFMISIVLIFEIMCCMHFQVKMLRISNGSQLFNLMQETLPATYLYVYVFNVTNSEAFLAGNDHKLKVQEVGPFTYQEFRTNKDFKLDEDEGVMSYYPFTTAEFQPNESIGDPQTFNVTVPNIAMLAGASMLNSHSIFAKSGFNLLAAQLKSQPIINLDLHSFLWGYEEPLITLGNSLIPGWITFNTLGLLDRLYDPATLPRLELALTDKDKFSIKTMDGCPGLKAWQYDNPSKRTRCNSFIDTYEGIVFPLGLTPETPIRLYRYIFCRMIELQFIGTRTFDYNSEAFVYKFRNNTFSANPETECLCGDNGCVDGVSNISPCFYGLSIGLSEAHFLHGDPTMYERIDGMHPDEKKHGSQIVIDHRTGIVLDITFTLQVNIIVRDVSFNSATSPFANMVVPLCYLKIVPPKMSEKIKYSLKLLRLVPYVIYGIEIVILVIALIMLVKATKSFLWKLFLHKEISFETSNDKPIINICLEIPLVEKRRQSLEVVKYQLDRDV